MNFSGCGRERLRCLQILEIQEGATEEEIKKAYRRQALKYHPDKNPSPNANAEFQQIQTAYDYLVKGESFIEEQMGNNGSFFDDVMNLFPWLFPQPGAGFQHGASSFFGYFYQPQPPPRYYQHFGPPPGSYYNQRPYANVPRQPRPPQARQYRPSQTGQPRPSQARGPPRSPGNGRPTATENPSESGASEFHRQNPNFTEANQQHREYFLGTSRSNKKKRRQAKRAARQAADAAKEHEAKAAPKKTHARNEPATNGRNEESTPPEASGSHRGENQGPSPTETSQEAQSGGQANTGQHAKEGRQAGPQGKKGKQAKKGQQKGQKAQQDKKDEQAGACQQADTSEQAQAGQTGLQAEMGQQGNAKPAQEKKKSRRQEMLEIRENILRSEQEKKEKAERKKKAQEEKERIEREKKEEEEREERMKREEEERKRQELRRQQKEQEEKERQERMKREKERQEKEKEEQEKQQKMQKLMEEFDKVSLLDDNGEFKVTDSDVMNIIRRDDLNHLGNATQNHEPVQTETINGFKAQDLIKLQSSVDQTPQNESSGQTSSTQRPVHPFDLPSQGVEADHQPQVQHSFRPARQNVQMGQQHPQQPPPFVPQQRQTPPQVQQHRQTPPHTQQQQQHAWQGLPPHYHHQQQQQQAWMGFPPLHHHFPQQPYHLMSHTAPQAWPRPAHPAPPQPLFGHSLPRSRPQLPPGYTAVTTNSMFVPASNVFYPGNTHPNPQFGFVYVQTPPQYVVSGKVGR